MDKLLLLALLLFSNSPSHAEIRINNSQVMNSKEMNSEVISSGDAKDWNLSENEWARFQKLMQGSNGEYYKSMTPPEVLGINAENEKELQHYAEITARQEHEKVERELRFDRAFHEAAKRLYPNEPIIKDDETSVFTRELNATPIEKISSLKLGDHLALFININGTTSSSLLANLIKQIKEVDGTGLDIYCLNYTDNSSIQDWARRNNIPVDLVLKDKITLNKNRNTNVLSKQLPFALLVRNGDSKQLNIEDL